VALQTNGALGLCTAMVTAHHTHTAHTHYDPCVLESVQQQRDKVGVGTLERMTYLSSKDQQEIYQEVCVRVE
jgi:hypothetical protein